MGMSVFTCVPKSQEAENDVCRVDLCLCLPLQLYDIVQSVPM